MNTIELSRAEARDLLILLERLENEVTDLGVLFQIDGFIRILMDRLFHNLPSDEE